MRVAFFGTPAFAVPTLDALFASAHELTLVVTQPDRPRGRGQQVSVGPVKARALAYDVPVLQPDRLTRDPWETTLAAHPFDVGVVAAYGRILPEWLLGLPRLGLINVHASLLPRYRGASPIQRAIMHGDTETGVTIMRVVKALDAGPMLDRVVVPIGPDVRGDELETALAHAGAPLLVQTVDRLAIGPVPEVAQDESLVTYAPRLTKDDGLVDWRRPARALHDQVRALHPWPHASTVGPRGRLILHRSRVDDDHTTGVPGEVLPGDTREGLRVATGSGVLTILELQAEGGRVLPARAFLTGHPLAPGDRLGSP